MVRNDALAAYMAGLAAAERAVNPHPNCDCLACAGAEKFAAAIRALPEPDAETLRGLMDDVRATERAGMLREVPDA